SSSSDSSTDNRTYTDI
ncbi:unnamed protein product, partial [Leptidea sinapis]